MGVKRTRRLFSAVLRIVLFLAASYPLMPSVWAGEVPTGEQYEKILAQARRDHPGLSLPEDDTLKYVIRAAEVSGNVLLPTRDLLGDIPVLHVVKSMDPNLPPQAYDFRVIRDVILVPGDLRQVSTRTIKGFTEYLLSRYRDRGYAGIYVYVSAKAIKPEDEQVAAAVRRLENDILPFRIIEGRVASVEIKRFDADGNRTETGLLKDSCITAWSPAKPGGEIKTKLVDDFVQLLNENPDRHVRHTVSTGDEPNSLNLTYSIYEADPWHPYIQVDNSGTDKRQWSPRIGFFNTNLTGRDDRASVMYQADVEDPGENYAAFGSYGLPVLTPRLHLSAFGGYSEFDITPEATGGFVNFLGAGSFYGGSLRYNLVQIGGWFFDVTGSLSAENSRINSNMGIGSDLDMRLLGLGVEVHGGDAMSATSVAFERTQNVGGSDAGDFEQARTGAEEDFIKYSVVASHTRYLDRAKVNHIGGSARFISSNDRLAPAKMTTFGGLYSVRGYPEDALVADGGSLASLEYRRSLITGLGAEEPAQGGKRKAWSTDISLLAFTDYGRAKIKDPLPGERGAQDLWGVGLGTLITVGRNFEARIYHGWALQEIERPSDGRLLADEGDSEWNFSFLYRW